MDVARGSREIVGVGPKETGKQLPRPLVQRCCTSALSAMWFPLHDIQQGENARLSWVEIRINGIVSSVRWPPTLISKRR